MLIRCIGLVLKVWRFEFLADLAWNAYSRPQNFGFWGSEPLNVIGHHRDPQKAHPWPKQHLRSNFGADQSWCDLCVTSRNLTLRALRQPSVAILENGRHSHQRSNSRCLYIQIYLLYFILVVYQIWCFYQKVHNPYDFLSYPAPLILMT